jgi:hypothetical protein
MATKTTKKGSGKVAKPKKAESKATKGKGELKDEELDAVSGGSGPNYRPGIKLPHHGDRPGAHTAGGVVVVPGAGPIIKGSTE